MKLRVLADKYSLPVYCNPSIRKLANQPSQLSEIEVLFQEMGGPISSTLDGTLRLRWLSAYYTNDVSPRLILKNGDALYYEVAIVAAVRLQMGVDVPECVCVR
jgi:hypothetical protein